MKNPRRLFPAALAVLALCSGTAPVHGPRLVLPAAQAAPAPFAPPAPVHMVAVRDGVKLATSAFVPAGAGPDQRVPVVLERTPYGRKKRAGGEELLLNMRGLAFVSQDLRGFGDSEGERTLLFESDGWGALQDGVDTLAWLAAQPWCNGKVATIGGSALGITQVQLAGAAPPELRACHIAVAASNLYEQAAYPGGAFRQAQIEGWMAKNRLPPAALARVRAHPAYDELWESVNAETRTAQVRVPAVHIGGWFDTFQQGTLNLFTEWQERGGAGARGNQYLIIGPWTHGGWKRARQGEREFGADALRSMNPLDRNAFQPRTDRWFARWLFDQADALDGVPRVQYYLMGSDEPGAPGNQWIHAESWPPAAQTRAFFLADGGRLTDAAPDAGSSRTFAYDPNNPLATRGGCNLLLPAGPMDQRPAHEGRADVLRFVSEPLAEMLPVVGRVTVQLTVSSSAPETDFTAKLLDVYPDGREMLVADGIRRTSHRAGHAAPKPLPVGERATLAIDLWSTALVFHKGHRVGVTVSSSNAPRFEPHPAPATNTVWLGGSHASTLFLPVPVPTASRPPRPAEPAAPAPVAPSGDEGREF